MMGKHPSHTCSLNILGPVPLFTHDPLLVSSPSVQAHLSSALWTCLLQKDFLALPQGSYSYLCSSYGQVSFVCPSHSHPKNMIPRAQSR